jgi:hypothetical protein
MINFYNPLQQASSMKRFSCLLGTLLVLATASSAFGYSTTTHTAMTWYSFTQSKLATDPSIFEQLGLTGMLVLDGEAPFRGHGLDRYIAIGSSPQWLQGDAEFEKKIMSDVRAPLRALPTDYTLTGWVMRGAIREDDNAKENPGDDPGGVFTRPFNHFYDPQHDVGLSFLGVSVGARAPDWALQDGAGSNKNIYNLLMAREAMWRALTGTTKDGQDAAPSGSTDVAAKEDVRKGYWATTFRILGDVVHLLQDMAQPQHTRNDAHSGLGCIAGICLGGHDGFYEKYIAARTLQNRSFSLEEGLFSTSPGNPVATTAPQLNYAGYNKPNFNQFADFFSTGTGTSTLTGLGLANYSNRGFYTFGTNVNSGAPFSSPDPLGLGLGRETISGPALTNMSGLPFSNSAISMTFLTGDVQDFVRGAPDTAVRLSTVGAWDQFLEQKGSASSHSLNYYNYNAQADLLIPRAVAYSAGLIDYFFRGTMKISLPDEGVYSIIDHSGFSNTDATANFTGFSKIKIKLSNTTPDIVAANSGTFPQTMDGGTLVAVVKFKRNTCYTDDLAGYPPFASEDSCRTDVEEIVVSDPANDGAIVTVDSTEQPFEFKFTNKQLPINATDVRLQVVYRGKLGAENDAVVVATQDLSEPTFFSYMNATDYIHINSKVYTRDEVNDTTKGLLPSVYPQSCVDYQLTPPQLKPSCLNPINTQVGFTVGSGVHQVQVSVDVLPVKRFIRLAILGNATDKVQMAMASGTTCYPHDPIKGTSNNCLIFLPDRRQRPDDLR